MPARHSAGFPARPRLSFAILCVLLVVLWLAGGASRADAPGQVIVRVAATVALVAVALSRARPSWRRGRPVWLLLGAAIVLALLQLVPLPPGIWTALPGRTILLEAAAAAGEPQPWRPWAIVPGAALNAAASLLVPLATLTVVASLDDRDRAWLPSILLGLIAAAMLAGMLQFTGIALNNPFINDTPGQVSGSFANRNHLALFLAIGCAVTPAWAFSNGRDPHWRSPLALGLVLLLALTILATGSRAGVLLAALGIGGGLMLVRQEMRRVLRRYPRWVFPAAVVALIVIIAAGVFISVGAGRAASVDRLLAADPGQDMRGRGLPTVLAMIREYFPAGSGLGGFDPLFRLHEPFKLLKPTYFNHAHNDYLEILLDAGVPGLLLLGSALIWWGWASARAWRVPAGGLLPRLGSIILLLVLIASVVDYPARTPMIMAIIVLAAYWMADRGSHGGSPLPEASAHL